MLDNVTHVTNRRSPFPPLSDKLNFRVAERDIGWHNTRTNEHVRIDKQKALVREYAGGGRWLSNVGENYQLVLNSDVFPHCEQHFIDVLEPHVLEGVEVHEHASYGGRDCWREYIFPNLKCDVREGDVSYRAIIGNSYGSKAITLLSGAIDGWCSNGMVIGAHEKQARKHTSGFMLSGLDTWITNSINQFAAHGRRMVRYENTHIDLTREDGLFEHLVKKGLLSERRAREAQEGMHAERNKRAGRDKRPTMWHLYSTLTDWASHSEVRDTGNDHEANTRIQRTQHAERVIKAADAFIGAV